jgi:hypothetical protein
VYDLLLNLASITYATGIANPQSRRQIKTALLSEVAMGKRRAGGGVNFGAVEKQKKFSDVFSSFSRRRKRAKAASFALDFFCFFFGSMPKKINQKIS